MTKTRDTGDFGHRTNFTNAIINGNFNVWQRGVDFVGIGNGDYFADRFRYLKTGSMVHRITQSIDTPDDQSNYCMAAECTTAQASIGSTDICYLRYAVEGYDIQPLYGKDLVLSFWIKSTITGTMAIHISSTGGTTYSYIVEITVDASDTWEKKNVLIPFNPPGGSWDFTNGTGMRIAFILACGSTYQGTAETWTSGFFAATSNQENFCATSSTIIKLSQVQLEVGQTPSTFEFRHYQQELALCQRYYHITDANENLGAGISQTTTAIKICYGFPVPMRTLPTGSATGTFIIFRNAGSVASSTISASLETEKSAQLTFENAGAGMTVGYAGFVRAEAGGFVYFDAEI